MPTIAILDYGFGNVLSVESACRELGMETERLERGNTLHAYDAAILPGSGAFGKAMRALEDQGLFSGLWNFYEEVRKPILGIGLGFHMLASGSEESPGQPGLNLLPGTARRLPSQVSSPFNDWLPLEGQSEDPLLNGILAGTALFCHVNHYLTATDPKTVLGEYTIAGARGVMAMRKGLVWGIQCDPTKSGEHGLKILQNFHQIVVEVVGATPEGATPGA